MIWIAIVIAACAVLFGFIVYVINTGEDIPFQD